MALGEISTALSILERLRSWYSGWQRSRIKPAESVATRFVRLCEDHGVHRNQIPRFVGGGLTLADVQDDGVLLTKLTEEILEAVCARFAVRREWLDGADAQVYPCHDFYKDPEAFRSFVKDLIEKNPEGRMQGVLIAPVECDERSDGALLVLQETIGCVGEKQIFRYHLCNNWAFTYWKARAYLTACVAVAWRQGIYIHGIEKPANDIAQLAQGERLLGFRGEGIWELGLKTWDPEDMALSPEAFLNGVDPEKENFGIKSGLALWLSLEEEGFMDSDLVPGAAELFRQELMKYQYQ